jgi:acid phosphatase type 7
MYAVLALFCGALLFTSCITSSQGRIRATKTGDLSRPLAPKESPTEGFRQACGDPGLTSDGDLAIRRLPYLQRTTVEGVRIVWTSVGSHAPQLVDVTTPDGAMVAEVAAEMQALHPSTPQLAARIEGLEPDTIYCYAIREAAADGAWLTRRIGFRTASDAGGPVRFVAFGDSGNGSEDQRTLQSHLDTVPYDFMLHTGDIAYDSGTVAELDEKYFNVYSPLLQHVSMFPVAGNHEYETDDAAPFRRVFDLPHNERWYSFDVGDVHFVGLDTERLDASQLTWLKADLAAHDRTWIVAFFHKPPFSSGEHGSEVEIRDALHPIFAEHAVDLVLTGHDHHYERTVPQDGVTYVVTGGGGSTYDVDPSSFTAFAEPVIHFVYVVVDEGELVLHAIDATGQEFDQLAVAK